jgi:uncharacterized protein YndB with AHSA1/START domain
MIKPLIDGCSMNRTLRTCLTIAFASFAFSAPAAEPKPDFHLKTKLVEANVTLDAKIKADAALAANCLNEGRAWAEGYRTEAEGDRKQFPETFRNGAWSVELKYETRSVVDGHYISIVRSDYTNTGGAHPNSGVNTILWDSSAKKRISIRPFFTETADGGPTMKAMAKAVLTSLTAEKKKRDAGETATDGWFEYVQPKLLKIGAVTLAPSTVAGKSSGLTFHYPPTAVGPYAEGEYTAYVPWETLKPYLTPEGAKIFGGARPNGDDDGQQ